MSEYNPEVFDAANMQAAMNIILTGEGGQSMAGRWTKETPYIARLAIEKLDLRERSLVLDWGCGIGRIAKPLVEAGAFVVGVDISPAMRKLAAEYLATPRFATISPEIFDRVAMLFEAAISVWTLQHAEDPIDDIIALRHAIRPGGRLLVVNNLRRAMPTRNAWLDDGKDIRAMLGRHLKLVEETRLDPAIVTTFLSENSFVGVYER